MDDEIRRIALYFDLIQRTETRNPEWKNVIDKFRRDLDRAIENHGNFSADDVRKLLEIQLKRGEVFIKDIDDFGIDYQHPTLSDELIIKLGTLKDTDEHQFRKASHEFIHEYQQGQRRFKRKTSSMHDALEQRKDRKSQKELKPKIIAEWIETGSAYKDKSDFYEVNKKIWRKSYDSVPKLRTVCYSWLKDY